MASKTWLDGGDNWMTPADWTGGSLPGLGDTVTIASGSPTITTDVGTVTSVDLSNAALTIEDGTIASTSFNDGGNLLIDYYGGSGESHVTVTDTLTNTSVLAMGNTSLSANDTLTAGALVNTGQFTLLGSQTNEAEAVIQSAAGFGTAGVLTGIVNLGGDALIDFTGGGQIGTIGSNGTLNISGTHAFLASGAATGSNSGVTGLTLNQGQLFLQDGVHVAPTGDLDNTGQIDLDYYGGEGGSSLAVAGTLTNGYVLSLGNTSLSANTNASAAALANTGQVVLTGSGANKAILTLSSTAGFGTAGVLTGSVSLNGPSLIDFLGNGEIGTIAAGGTLSLSSASAFVADSTDTASNSALTGLTVNDGALFLANGATVAPAGDIDNLGQIFLDYFGGQGGSHLAVLGTLTNGNLLSLGNTSLSVGDEVSATALHNTGQLTLTGSGTNTASVVLQSTAGFGTAGVLTGSVSLSGPSLIDFLGNGEIGTIATAATLSLSGTSAFVADSTDTSHNSALTGLATNDGVVFLANGAAVAPAGDLDNAGQLFLDYFGGQGSAQLTVGGTLTNTDLLSLGNSALSGNDRVTAAALNNTGQISLYSGTTFSATAVISGAAGFGTIGILTGNVGLHGDTQIDFLGGGQIGTIATSAILSLDGAQAFIGNSGTPTGNSALTGLTENDGQIFLADSATIATTGSLANTDQLFLDYFGGQGGAAFSVGGLLTNTGTILLGNNALSASDSLTAGSLENAGNIVASGSGTNLSVVTISGEVDNDGTLSAGTAGRISILGDLGAEPTHTGRITIGTGGEADLDGSVAADQTIAFTGTNGLLHLGEADNVLGTISNFFLTDTIDLGGIVASKATLEAGNVLAITSTNGDFDLQLDTATDYTGKGFSVASDGNGGTDVTVYCFYPGTRILTPSGEVAIERLATGDTIVTADGRHEPIRWMAHQTVSKHFGDPLRVLPIRIGAGALGDGLPVRDLLVSPDHALLLDGLLVQAGALVNGTTITRERDVPETYTFYNIELAAHELIVAEGVAAESFVDHVDRAVFDNGAEHAALYPDCPPLRELPHPRISTSRQVPAALRARLAGGLERAAA